MRKIWFRAYGKLLTTTLLVAGLVVFSFIVLKFTDITVATSSLKTLADQKNLYIGAAVNAALVTEQGCAQEPLYCQTLINEYNMVTPENAMKFNVIHPQQGVYDFSQADAIVAGAQANNIKVRGHALLYSQATPTWVTNGNFTPEQLQWILWDHITTVVNHFKNNFPGVVIEWDVINEGGDLGVWGQIGTLDQVATLAFVWTRQADPDVKLYYNDADNEGYYSAKSNWVYNLVTNWKNIGIPIDGVGLQAHFGLPTGIETPSLSDMEANLTRYANAGLEVKFTELDVSLTDNTPASLNAQAGVYNNVMTACVNISSCKGVITWGFTDKYSWIPQFWPGYGWALPFDENYNPKPAYTALHDALSVSIPTSATSSTITISAYGTPVQGTYPRMELRSGNTTIAAWDVTGTAANYSYTTYVDLNANNVRVYFTNDAYVAPEDRNLTVNSVIINGKIYTTASPLIYGVGVWTGSACGSGYYQTDALLCNGYFEYPTTATAPPSTITIQAKGTPFQGVNAQMQLQHGTNVLGIWTVTGFYQNYIATTTDNLTNGNLKVYFMNAESSNNRKLTVSSLTLNGRIYTTTAPNVYDYRTIQNNTCVSGYLQIDILGCGNSYFDYPTAIIP